MVAELRTDTQPLPLLVEPDRPLKSRAVYQAWKRVVVREQGCLVAKAARDHTLDAHGAAMQHMIVRYIVGGESRAALATEHQMAPHVCQNYLRGTVLRQYTRPVLRALQRLGISSGQGSRSRGGRLQEIIRAQQKILARLIANPDNENAKRDAELLLAGLDRTS